jgi:salicylate hydroxylase
MSPDGRLIYVAGAGIAGMTLALALAKFGATVVVLERNASIQEAGAGLQVSPNGRHILNRLGLDRPLAARSFEPDGIDIYPYGARDPLVTLELGPIMREEFGAAYSVMHRADLADVLHKACKRFANIDILFGVRAYDVEPHARGVAVLVEEADGKTRSANAFAFIGADGVHSRTRTDLLGGPAAQYSGMVAWRTTIDERRFPTNLSRQHTSVLWGPGYHAVTYPLPARGEVNAVLFTRVKASDLSREQKPTAPKLPWAVLPSRMFSALVEAGGDSWSYWPAFTVDAPTWHKAGIGLIGDAAHAMLPFQAQGAMMAVEDAAVLAPLLIASAEAESALARYSEIRQPRVRRVQAISRSNGAAFHMEWPFTLGRDAVVKAQGPRGHIGRLEWLYGHDAAESIDAPRPGKLQRSGVN